jgi:restriction endonuclease S subunit
MISLQETKVQAPWACTMPREWRICRLKSVADIRYGLGQPPAELSSGVAMIRATDVDAGTIQTTNLLRVDPAGLPRDRNPYLKADEIVVVRSGAYTGDSAIVPSSLEGAVAGYDMVVTVTRASPTFVAYSLLSKCVLEDQLLLLTLRAAQPHLNAEELGGVVLAMLPTRDEQQRIAAYLDASCAAIDAAVAAKRSQLETLDSMREALIESAVTRGLRRSAPMRAVNEDWITEIPVHWEVCRIKRIVCRVDYGISVRTEPEGRYSVLKMGHIQRGEIEFRDLDFVEDVEDHLLLERGDLLYNRTNSPDQKEVTCSTTARTVPIKLPRQPSSVAAGQTQSHSLLTSCGCEPTTAPILTFCTTSSTAAGSCRSPENWQSRRCNSRISTQRGIAGC